MEKEKRKEIYDERTRRHEKKLDAIIEWQERFDSELRPKIEEVVETLTKARTVKEFVIVLFKLIVGIGTLSGLAVGTSIFFHNHIK